MTKAEPRTDAADDLASQAVPLTEHDATVVKPGDIPLPPEELRDQLDNSGIDTDGDEAADLPVEVAELDFFGDELPSWTHPLKYKFRWQGQSVETVTVRQLTVAEQGKVYAEARKKKQTPDLFDFYAAMTGLPPAVLRALPALDGDPIINRCWDFLPPSVRPAPD